MTSFAIQEPVGSSHHLGVNSISTQSDHMTAWGAPVEVVSFGPVPREESIRADNDYLVVAPRIEKWTAALDRRFDKLAERYATGELTREESRELRSLESARDELLAPVDVEDIRRLLSRRKMVNDLMATLSRYAKWQESENSAPQKA